MVEILSAFSSTERRGITAFIMIIVLFILSTFTMQYFVTTPKTPQTDTALLVAWEQYKQANSGASTYDNDAVIASGLLFSFDPNTLDSNGFIKLGLRPRTTHLLLNWRRKGKVFYKKEDFKNLYTLSKEQYIQLEPYITINEIASNNSFQYNNNYKNAYAPTPEHVNINTTDSATLVRLRGIGPYFAHKIIERRKALGGYINHQQLMEAYRFPDTTLNMLKEKLIIDVKQIKKINLNNTTENELKVHPYIGEKTAKNIILYRDAMKRFEKIEQLRQVPLMNEEIYRKLVPYLSID